MSSLFRCAAAVSLAVLAVTAGAGAASADTLTAADPVAVGHPEPQDAPLNFGPFQVPRYGTVSGGFTWDAH
ncbi:hypothetical protein [Streptomyces longisporoflavus]|uniref:Uncharacterized protein n=1 Tax=Streptomyces longisporoflavus TaxID=28044 RepID=A0ABW7QF35_9ACTN